VVDVHDGGGSPSRIDHSPPSYRQSNLGEILIAVDSFRASHQKCPGRNVHPGIGNYFRRAPLPVVFLSVSVPARDPQHSISRLR